MRTRTRVCNLPAMHWTFCVPPHSTPLCSPHDLPPHTGAPASGPSSATCTAGVSTGLSPKPQPAVPLAPALALSCLATARPLPPQLRGAAQDLPGCCRDVPGAGEPPPLSRILTCGLASLGKTPESRVPAGGRGDPEKQFLSYFPLGVCSKANSNSAVYEGKKKNPRNQQ